MLLKEFFSVMNISMGLRYIIIIWFVIDKWLCCVGSKYNAVSIWEIHRWCSLESLHLYISILIFNVNLVTETFLKAFCSLCRITVTERKLEDVQYEVRGWEEKNKRNLDRVSVCKWQLSA